MLLTESRKMPSSARPPSSCTPVSDARACAGPWACPPSRLPQGAGLSLGAVLGETRGKLSSEPGPSSPVTTPPSAPAPSVVRGPAVPALPQAGVSSCRRAAGRASRRRGEGGPRDKVETNLGVVGQEALPDRSSTGGSDLATQDPIEREWVLNENSLLITPQGGSRDPEAVSCLSLSCW